MKHHFLRVLRIGVLGLASGVLLPACQSSAADMPATAATPAKNLVVGNLGGAPVSIPGEWVSLVEYNADPHSLLLRNGSGPAPTHASSLGSFSVLLHFPTKRPLTSVNAASYHARKLWEPEWITLGVTAGEMLGNWSDGDFADPFQWNRPGKGKHLSYEYEPLPQVHGLQAWRAKTKLLNTSSIVLDDNDRSQSVYNHHAYFAFEGDKVVAYIECASGLPSAPGGVQTCQHHFVLWPQMRAKVSIRYVVEELPRWQSYQSRTRDLLLSWRLPGSPLASALPPAAALNVRDGN